MFLLLVCILFNAFIGIAFKYFEKYKVRNLQAIVINYFVCTITASMFIGKPAITLAILDKVWLWPSIALGFAFIIVFRLFALSVQKIGIVISSIFQKMSLIAPTIIAILCYNEAASWIKIFGIGLAVVSIAVISYGSKAKAKIDANKPAWIWLLPLGIFVGSCLIDTGLMYVNINGLVNNTDIDFVATLFFFAGCFGAIFVVFDYLMNGTKFRLKELIAGIALGIPNFFSIYFLLLVLSSGMDASQIFPINNVGILVLTALLGLMLFGEKFNTQKLIGFLLAISAIILIANG